MGKKEMKAQAILLGFALTLPLWQNGISLPPMKPTRSVRPREPNLRLKLYVQFAHRQRVDRLKSLFSSQKPGRSALIHDLLDDYGKIIESIDIVTDDALERKLGVNEGVGAVASAEKAILPILQKFADSEPKDLGRYEFSLKQAISATSDSLELAEADLRDRAGDVQAKAARRRRRRSKGRCSRRIVRRSRPKTRKRLRIPRRRENRRRCLSRVNRLSGSHFFFVTASSSIIGLTSFCSSPNA